MSSSVPHPDGLPPAPGWPIHPAMVTSAIALPGFRIKKSLGLVRGLTVRAPGVSRSFSAALQAFGGGDVQALREVCETARQDAVMLMMEDAVRYSANGVIGFRYDTTELGESMTEVLAYGTSVLFEAE